jgi:hypothetical protein
MMLAYHNEARSNSERMQACPRKSGSKAVLISTYPFLVYRKASSVARVAGSHCAKRLTSFHPTRRTMGGSRGIINEAVSRRTRDVASNRRRLNEVELNRWTSHNHIRTSFCRGDVGPRQGQMLSYWACETHLPRSRRTMSLR